MTQKRTKEQSRRYVANRSAKLSPEEKQNLLEKERVYRLAWLAAHPDRDGELLHATSTEKENFFGRVQENESGCLLYQTTTKNGYGRHYFRYRSYNAHRIALIWATGGVPFSKAHALHRCFKMRSCVNPDHLYWGTSKQNAADCSRDWPGRNFTPRGEAASACRLSDDDCRHIFHDFWNAPVKNSDLAKKYKVDERYIRDIAHKRKRSTALVNCRIPKDKVRVASCLDLRSNAKPRQGMLNDIQREEIRRLCGPQGSLTQREVAKKYGVNNWTIYAILHKVGAINGGRPEIRKTRGAIK